eukprot:CAMPEP_0172652476 /NCGR_PEP_ID=MMETSP1068-20121228/243335_1 /TAXON_ID=35684 /ORGANISM="Pseudopedinella elastica, Strain CCMP716" /LENGTH=174 /DNA_ID=CAMNT_0013466883 /DNA_START=197 /DNA_END=722 /DNA_ORIENTATION=-
MRTPKFCSASSETRSMPLISSAMAGVTLGVEYLPFWLVRWASRACHGPSPPPMFRGGAHRGRLAAVRPRHLSKCICGWIKGLDEINGTVLKRWPLKFQIPAPPIPPKAGQNTTPGRVGVLFPLRIMRAGLIWEDEAHCFKEFMTVPGLAAAAVVPHLNTHLCGVLQQGTWNNQI